MYRWGRNGFGKDLTTNLASVNSRSIAPTKMGMDKTGMKGGFDLVVITKTCVSQWQDESVSHFKDVCDVNTFFLY